MNALSVVRTAVSALVVTVCTGVVLGALGIGLVTLAVTLGVLDVLSRATA